MSRSSILLLVGFAVLAVACGGNGSTVDTAAGPVISSVEPASGGQAGGTPIRIKGSSLSNPQAGEYEVLIGGQPAEDIVVIDDTEVECTTPPGAMGPADVVIITVEGEDVAPSAFTFHPPPTVTGITPTEGTRDGGVLVTVTGTGFTANDPGTSVCLIGLKLLDDLTVVDDTTITGYTPSSWTEVPKDVFVRNRNGEGRLGHGFTYVGPVPLVYDITPIEGPRSGGTFCTITGEYFTEAGGDLSVRFGNAEASIVTRVDDQTLTCFSPLSAVPGLVDVTVGNNNGESSLPNAFYYIPAPILDNVTPGSGTIAGGTLLTVTGSGFTAVGAGTTILTLDGELVVNPVIVNDTTITCETPPGSALGLVDMRIVNGNGSSTLSNAFEYTFVAAWDPNYTAGASTGPNCDDCYTARSFSGGFTFPFFSSTYSTVYLSSNGSVCFSAYSSLSNAVPSVPHISLFQRDMNPSSGGTIYFKQETSRVVITYDGVNQYYSGGPSTCQVQLYANGIFAMMYRTVGTTSFRSGVGPGSGQTSRSVDWSSGPDVGSSDAANEFFGSFDLTDTIIAFLPDGSGGYTTLILDIN